MEPAPVRADAHSQQGVSSLREQIAAQLPDHAIAFDVVFESAGKRVDWHGDYESLGPFAFGGVQSSIRNRDPSASISTSLRTAAT